MLRTADTEKNAQSISRRAALSKAGRLLAAIAVVVAGVPPAFGKAKSAKEDFFFQEEPDESGKHCETCINFTAKPDGQYGAKSGDCALLEGDVCTTCYCQGWTDKNAPGAKRAGT
jgi:hypothetical protein